MQDAQRKKLLRMLAWSSAILVIAGLALGIAFVVQPLMQRDLWGRKGYSHEPFMLWYPEGSPQIAAHEELGSELINVLQDVAATLHIDSSHLPERMDVFIHDDTAQLMSLLARRKGTDRMNAKAPFDLLAGEDPTKAVTELLLNHIWDTTPSQIVYEGLLQCMANPEQNFHAPVAAMLENQVFSLAQLLELERGGAYPLTFYQQWVSPTSARYVFALTDIANYYAVPETLLSESTQDLPTLLAASLVQMLLDRGDGILPIKNAWRLPNTESILESASGRSLTELDTEWRQQALSEGELSSDFRLWQASFCIHSGNYTRALGLFEESEYVSLEPALYETVLTAAVLQQNLSLSEQLLELPQADRLPSSLKAWAQDVLSMEHLPPSERLSVSGHLSSEELANIGHIFDQAYVGTVSTLGLDEASIPRPIRVFIYPSDEMRRRAKKILNPPLGDLPSIHLTAEETEAADFAFRVVSRFWNSSASNLLNTGLSQWLTLSKEEILDRACMAERDGEWLNWLRLTAQPPDHPIVATEMGLYISCLIDLYGSAPLAELWHETTMWGGGHSLRGALNLIEAVDFDVLEDAVKQELETCDES